MTTDTPTRPHVHDSSTGVRELFCGACGYGIVIRRDPPDCPMCRACAWQERPGFERWN